MSGEPTPLVQPPRPRKDLQRPQRRRLLAATSLAAVLPASLPTLASTVMPAGLALSAAIAGCTPHRDASYDGGWIGASHERGHLLRGASKSGTWPAPAIVRRTGVVVVGGGIAGLGAARALDAAGVDDHVVLELEDTAGGNSRGHAIAGMRCPLGAHYLPLPGEQAVEVIELLDALGVRKQRNGRAEYDERMLCFSPQERLHIDGGWRDGLLPPVEALPAAERGRTALQYRRFARLVQQAAPPGAFTIPTARSRWSDSLTALDAVTFASWLDRHGLDAPALRWYLDYCCRDDYGAVAAQVSAWAGIHYFASRHGFHAPGDAAVARSADGSDSRDSRDSDALLTWPEGNAWLAQRLAAPLGDRLHAGRVALRVREARAGVEVDVWDAAAARPERWLARQAVLAVPLFIAARLFEAPPPALAAAVHALPYAPWLVGNVHIDTALDDRPGAPLAWDNVAYGAPSLGYVDAMHQSLRPFAGPTVLTAYWALGGDSQASLEAARKGLLEASWQSASARVVAELATMHPDIAFKVRRVDLMRYGHAMAVPVPGLRGSAALRVLAEPQPRVQFAHADLSACSVFEEALYQGMRAGRVAAGVKSETGSGV